MQKVFEEVGSLDKKCYEKYSLSEDILMEHAALAMFHFIEKNFEKDKKILIVCGSGNNGADGITLARLLHKSYPVSLFLKKEPKTQIGKLQLQRAKSIGVELLSENQISQSKYDLIVDALFGSGFDGVMSKEYQELIEQLNSMQGYKLACDIPSGVDYQGRVENVAFLSDTTVTMGALKKSLFLDEAKDFVGKIIVADLGVNRELYENNSDIYLLDLNDLKTPKRTRNNTHKGNFGHFAVVVGQKLGAGVLCADAAFHFGAGLVSVIDHKEYHLPYHIMQTHKLPTNTTAIALGMGLGNYEKKEIMELLQNDTPKVIDADIFYEEDIKSVLKKQNIVLTPHPKEFCSLLEIVGLATIDVKSLQKNRFDFVKLFCQEYPKVVLLLKGANTLIAQDQKIYINPHGTTSLSFGGSGDILSGLIGSLLAQGYEALEAAIQGSLAHCVSAMRYEGNNYSMTPKDLIMGIKTL